MSVSGLEIDVVKYAGRKDFQVLGVFQNSRKYSVIVRRLDTTEGWSETLKVLAYFTEQERTQEILIGPSTSNEKIVEMETDFDLSVGQEVRRLPNYEPLPVFIPQRIGRVAFNRLFDSDLVQLPSNLFAVGIKGGCVYFYNETYEFLYMIELTIKHMVGVALADNLFEQLYFVICAYDGFLEGHYPEKKTGQVAIGTEECRGKKNLLLADPSKFPVLHKDLTILAQSHQDSTPNAISVPDRYYFYLNRYNEYRSIHGGVPFDRKKPQIAYGSQPRGSKYNFTRRRDIEKSPREYFYSDAVPKTNIVAPQWIDRADMIGYKYILDIDGNSSTWDATAWKLNSGSVILKTDSTWNQWFYDQYKPWVHYVPVADDFSDLQEQFAWCESHQEECRQMIKECRALFQQAYRYQNVLDYTRDALCKLSRLQPAYIDPTSGRRLFLFSFDHADTPCVVNKALNKSDGSIKLPAAAHRICRRLRPTDLVMYANLSLLDFNGFNPADLLQRYDRLDKAIVFGAEKNLWPESIEVFRFKIEQLASPGPFKYLNSGFFIASAGELKRLLDERVYEDTGDFIDQVYFLHAYLTGRYSMTLDYNNSLVLNTFRCDQREVDDARQKGTPFIHFNGGRW
jgi:hypothetical protein